MKWSLWQQQCFFSKVEVDVMWMMMMNMVNHEESIINANGDESGDSTKKAKEE